MGLLKIFFIILAIFVFVYGLIFDSYISAALVATLAFTVLLSTMAIYFMKV